MKKINSLFSIFFVGALLLLGGCDKTKVYDLITPPPQAHFITSGGSYYISNSSSSSFKIPIGTTNVSNVDRKVTVSVSSPTNAAAGVQYNLPSTTVTIPAGKAVDSITVNGLFAGYASGRKDTLTFTISGGDVEPGSFNSTYKLVLQKYCDVVLSNLAGSYTQSFDVQGSSYGPYTSVVSATSTGATSATLVIKNFSAAAFGPFVSTDAAANPGITVNIDWSNPANFTTTIPAQSFYKDPSYGAATITGVGTGSFSSCDNTFTFNYKVTVAAGSFGNFTTTLKR
jgi:hypothetical protein